MRTVLVTGGAGFIGSHLIRELLARGDRVISIDNFSEVNYEKQIKIDRIRELICAREYRFGEKEHSAFDGQFVFFHGDILDQELMQHIFSSFAFDKVVHLAAHGGVRNSLSRPLTYVRDNVAATVAIFEHAVRAHVPHVLYASSSSVYGGNTEMPFREDHRTDLPLAPYPASKQACERFAQAYHSAYGMQMTGMRFFTVYGPWGRPDMALYIFAKNISEAKPIDVYNHGKMRRDFTYIADIISGIIKLMDAQHGHEIFNLANGKSEQLSDFISYIEGYLGKTARKNLMEMQTGDVPESFGSVDKARDHVGYTSTTDISEGIRAFITWFKRYHKIA